MMIRSIHDLLFSRICVGWSINWKRALLSINSSRAIHCMMIPVVFEPPLFAPTIKITSKNDTLPSRNY